MEIVLVDLQMNIPYVAIFAVLYARFLSSTKKKFDDFFQAENST